MSILPEDVMSRVEEGFNTRESRAVAIELLTTWRKLPNWKEKEAIGDRHGRSGKTVHKIVLELQEMELFTENEGSIPLYRIEREKQTAPTIEEKEQLESVETVEVETGQLAKLPLVSPAGFPLDLEPEETNPSEGEISSEELSDLKNKVNRMEAQVGNLNKQIETLIPVIRGLSAKTPEINPKNNPRPPVEPTPQTPKTEIQEPFPGVTRDELLEIALNQPNQFLAMVGATGGRPLGQGLKETDVMASPETIRKMIIEVRTYTMMLYEKAIADGAFEGSMSDFLNDMAEKYFEDRGYALGWHRFEPGRRRLG